jgi:tetratricopeptide (TPR) repeat protein
MENTDLRSQGWFGRKGKDGFIYRAWMKNQGIPDEEFRPTQHSRQEKPLIYPIYTEDYFLQQGEKISPVLPTDIDSLKTAEEVAKSLMVMMSFSEWLLHFKSSTEKQKEETKDQRALKTMWQKEKLAAAIEEENEEIPENVFEMAVNSITKEDGLASESLADIYIKQGKLDKAIDMYRKLSLRNPQKNAYFARKIEEILKEKQL